MDHPPAIVEPDVDRGPILIVLYLVLCITAFLFILGRLVIRIRGRNIGADDILALFAAIMFIGLTVCIVFQAIQGIDRHIVYLTVEQLGLSIEYGVIQLVFHAVAVSLGRIAICLLILRIIGGSDKKRHRQFLWTMIVVNAVLCTVICFMPLMEHQDPQSTWEVNSQPNVTHLKASKQLYDVSGFVSISLVIMEFLLALYPSVLLWDIQISKRKKIVLCVLLGLGVLTGSLGAFKTKQGQVLITSRDPTFDVYYLQMFTCLETFCLLVFGSLPAYKAPFDRFMDRTSRFKLSNRFRDLIRLEDIEAHHTIADRSFNKSGYTVYIGQKDLPAPPTSTYDGKALSKTMDSITLQEDLVVESCPASKGGDSTKTGVST